MNKRQPNLKKAWLAQMWWETAHGKRMELSDLEARTFKTPSLKTYPYAGSCFPSTIRENIYRRRSSDGGYGSDDLIASSGSSANSEDLILALVQKEKYKLWDAVRIVSQACERCLNILGHRYKLGWGYSVKSAQAKQCNTVCRLCAEGKGRKS